MRGAPFGRGQEKAYIVEDAEGESSTTQESDEDSCANSGEEDETALQAKTIEKCDACGKKLYLTKCLKYMG